LAISNKQVFTIHFKLLIREKMANIKGFLQYKKELPKGRKIEERLGDFKEVYDAFPLEKTVEQANRCMDCGIAFCHNGCPLGNLIPEFNDAVQEENWISAYQILQSTNNFPEFTGRICPAPCEHACVLGINQPSVSIEHIEKSIIEMAFERGFVRPQPPVLRTGKKVAIVGSGPAGLAAAAQLNKAGHTVTVFEKNDRIGGLLRYGIPDFKMEKWTIDRRVALMKTEGIRFELNAEIGKNVDSQELIDKFDAVLLCTGASVARDLPLPNRSLKGVYFAMDFLTQNNKRVAGDTIAQGESIEVKGKNVIVVGGGDTGSDCIGTSNRLGAKSVSQLAYSLMPPSSRSEDTPWPHYPFMLQTSSSHEEGCERQWAVLTKAFVANDKNELKGLQVVDVEWNKNILTGKNELIEKPETLRELPCDLVFIAAGFVGTPQDGLVQKLGLEINSKNCIEADDYKTNVTKVFAAGDNRRGQSLVVWAISEGREAAVTIDEFLMGTSLLERKDESFLKMVEG
jgi:glutamate synthase (NADPH) small chain